VGKGVAVPVLTGVLVFTGVGVLTGVLVSSGVGVGVVFGT
jgi:hypothetical protein